MTNKQIIIGISCYYHDSSITVIQDGLILFALQEERVSRIKNDSSFPKKALGAALKYLSIDISEVSAFVFYEKPLLKFERLMEGYLAISPFGFKSFKKAIPDWAGKKFFLKRDINKNLKEFKKLNFEKKIFFSEHHLSHLASSFYPSPFSKALLLSIDGVGEMQTTTIAIGEDNKIFIKEELNYPHSLGLLYSAFTYFLGFKVNDGEYKMMGLAPYGSPKYENLILDKIIDLKNDGSFQLNLKYFNFITGLTMTNKYFDNLFGISRRNKEEKILQIHMDIASSIQKVTEKILLLILKYAKEKYKYENLCLSGGVALNCVANGKIYKEGMFKNIWIQPASGDAGGSMGAALAYYYFYQANQRIKNVTNISSSYLGPKYQNDEIIKYLNSIDAKFYELDEQTLLDDISNEIISGKIIGWFQGRTEFGPRALGNRSIIADSRNPDMQRILNLKTKFREGFRPFAPSILEEEVNNWFDFDSPSPYMLMVGQVKKDKLKNIDTLSYSKKDLTSINQIRSSIPAVTHVDNSARIQTVSKDSNKIFYELIKAFHKKTGVPILINTSFNVNNEPIVNTYYDAYHCFMNSNIDILVLNNILLKRAEQYSRKPNDLFKNENLS